jgi:hypothetical protein
MRFFHHWDGRWLAILMLLSYMSILLLGSLWTHAPVAHFWRHLGVPALDRPFEDLRILAEGPAVFRHGGDLRKNMDSDPEKRPYNYPHWWLYSEKLGLNAGTLNDFGVGIGTAFFITTLLVWGKLTLPEGLWASLFLLSPCVMLGVERGNIDLVIFILLGLALAARRVIPLSLLLVVGAACLKLYPIFALLAFVARPWRKTLPWLIAAIFTSLAYFFAEREELQRIFVQTPHGVDLSYGASIPLMALLRSDATVPILIESDIVLLILVGLSIKFGLQASRSAQNVPAERELFAFRCGAGIFLGTFALGTNWDYRLIFLAFCLPLLFRLRGDGNTLRAWAGIALTLILLYSNWNLYSVIIPTLHVILKSSLSWGLILSLSYILAATSDFRIPRQARRNNP